MKMIFSRVLCILLLLLINVQGYAIRRDSTSNRLIHMIGADFRPAYTIPTSAFMRGKNKSNDRIATTLSGHLKYGFKFSPDTYWGTVYPHAIQGIGIGYNTFFNGSELGNPLAVYVFQSSRIARIAPRLSLDYEWNFGLSFHWKQYDKETNAYNRVIGSERDAYIYLNFLLNWQLSANTNLTAGIGFAHYSNGSTKFPNFGVNTLGGTVGVTHFFGDNKESLPPVRSRIESFTPYVSYDLILYGAYRQKRIYPDGAEKKMLVPGKFGIVGLNFNPLYNFNRYFRAGVSLDMQYDESANIVKYVANETLPTDPADLKFHKVPFRAQFSVGLSLRAELVMPIFSVNVGIGKNLISSGADNNFVYQVLVLKTDITKNLFIHTGYQLYHFKDPNNLMFGIGYRFNAKGKI